MSVLTRVSRAAEWGLAGGFLLWLSGGLGPLYLFVLPLVVYRIVPVGFLLTVLLLVVHWRRVHSLLRTAWPLLLLVVLAAASAFWSVAPFLSLRRAIALTGSTAFGMLLAVRFRRDQQLKLLAVVLGVVACGSLALALLRPQYGVMTRPFGGAWRGLYPHKNQLGRIMGLAAFVFVFLGSESRRLRPVAFVGLGLSLFLVYESVSRSAEIAETVCAAALGLFCSAQRLPHRRRTQVLIAAATVAAVMIVWAVQHGAALLPHLGKDPTLNRRTELWAVLVDMIRARPWLGYGYGAFWQGPSGVSRELRNVFWHWTAPHAHNGFIDLTLALGVCGLALFVVSFVVALRQAYTWAMAEPSLARLWPLTYLLLFGLTNLTESVMLLQNNIFWPLYVAVVLTLQQDAGPPERLPA